MVIKSPNIWLYFESACAAESFGDDLARWCLVTLRTLNLDFPKWISSRLGRREGGGDTKDAAIAEIHHRSTLLE